MIDKKRHKLVNLSIRDYNSTACRPKESRSQTCTPSCDSSQVCVYQILPTQDCACPPLHCVDKKPRLQISSLVAPAVPATTTEDSSNNSNKTALIVGLTTGLVVLALIAVTIAGFVFYRRRKLQKLLLSQQREEEEKQRNSYYSSSHNQYQSSSIPSSTPRTPERAMFSPPTPISEASIPYHLSHWNSQPPPPQVEEYIDYNHPQSPFIIGAQSLQIPHLDDITTAITPDPTIRRSLNLGYQQQPPSPITALGAANNFIERSSSVKVTKYDYKSTPRRKRNIPTTIIDADDLDEKVTIKRAVSVKKNNSTSSSITRVGSVSSSVATQDVLVCAKPAVVRINTISLKREKSGSITRKTSIKRINNTEQERGPFNVSLHDEEARVSHSRTNSHEDEEGADASTTGEIDFYLCPPPPALVNNNSSQISIQTTASSSSSQSTLGDGSITVFWESPNHSLT